MNDSVITDLKQFIAATMLQQLTALEVRFDDKLANLDNKLSTKIDNLTAAVAEAIDDLNIRTDRVIGNHEKRLTRLERKTAKL